MFVCMGLQLVCVKASLLWVLMKAGQGGEAMGVSSSLSGKQGNLILHIDKD